MPLLGLCNLKGSDYSHWNFSILIPISSEMEITVLKFFYTFVLCDNLIIFKASKKTIHVVLKGF